MKHTGLAFLLNLLSVSPTKMAGSLNIDRTLISKWKSGARKVDTNNPYFEKLIDYLIFRNEEIGIHHLENLFAEVYGFKKNQYELKNDLSKFTKTFIIENTLVKKQYQQQNNDFSYISSVEVYDGQTNKKKSMLKLLEQARKEKTPCKLTFIFYGVLDIFINDTDFRHLWLENILQLLDRNFYIEFICSSSDKATFIKFFPQLIFHKNCLLLTQLSDSILYNTYSLYILENKMVILSIRNTSEMNFCDYSSIYQDPLSIIAYSSIADRIRHKCVPTFATFSATALLKRESQRSAFTNTDIFLPKYNTGYVYNCIPDFYFMNKNLYTELLMHNGYSGKKLQAELALNLKRKLMFEKSLEHCTIIHFYPINILTDLAAQDTISYHSKDSVLYPPLVSTQPQFKQHMNDVAEFLLNHPNFNICLTSEPLSLAMPTLFCWCKRNESIFLFDRAMPSKYLVSQDFILINALAESFEELLLSSPDYLRSNTKVAEILLAL